MRLLLVAGERSSRLMDAKMRNLRTRYLQVDEVWTYVQKKRTHVRKEDSAEIGDQWVTGLFDRWEAQRWTGGGTQTSERHRSVRSCPTRQQIHVRTLP